MLRPAHAPANVSRGFLFLGEIARAHTAGVGGGGLRKRGLPSAGAHVAAALYDLPAPAPTSNGPIPVIAPAHSAETATMPANELPAAL
jgi:hypothetical protein